jgi:transposase
VLRFAARHTDPTMTWLKNVQARRNTNIAAVALANKHARIVWALLAYEREYRPDYTVTSP